MPLQLTVEEVRDSFTGFWLNKKNKTSYYVSTAVINATNAQDGQIMVLYHDGTENYCREVNEFLEKFERTQ